MALSDVLASEKEAPSRISATRNSRGDPEQQIETSAQTILSGPPNGGYGWVVVVAVLFLNAATWGESATIFLYPTKIDMFQVSTLRSECIYLTLKPTLRFLGPLP